MRQLNFFNLATIVTEERFQLFHLFYDLRINTFLEKAPRYTDPLRKLSVKTFTVLRYRFFSGCGIPGVMPGNNLQTFCNASSVPSKRTNLIER